MGQPVVVLHGLEGLALVVECSSGVLYTTQAGGVSNVHPRTEGVLVPLGAECSIENKLAMFFAERGGRGERLEPVDADALDRILRTPEEPFVVTPTFFLEVDRSRLADSMEAWLHVTIMACPDEHLIGFSQDRSGRLSDITTLSGRAWAPADQPELGPHVTLYPISGFSRRAAVLTWPNSD